MNDDQMMLLFPCQCGDTLTVTKGEVLDCCFARAAAFARAQGYKEPPDGWEAFLRRDEKWHRWMDREIESLGELMNDKEFLTWLRDRLVFVYKESENVDFVQRLDKIIAGMFTDDQLGEMRAKIEADVEEAIRQDMAGGKPKSP